MTLREKLIDAKLAGEKVTIDGYPSYAFNTNETAAEKAIAVFVAWLRESGHVADLVAAAEQTPTQPTEKARRD